MSGWIKIHRELFEHWVYEDAYYFRAWLWIIQEANHTEGEWLDKWKGQIVKVPRGTFITSLRKLNIGTKLSFAGIKKFLNLLQAQGMITYSFSDQHFTKITICNYEKFQDNDKEKRSLDEALDEAADATPDEALDEAADEDNIRITKKGKNVKNGKKLIASEFSNNSISEDDYEKVINDPDYGNGDREFCRIEFKKFKNYYLGQKHKSWLGRWRNWLIKAREIKEQQNKPSYNGNKRTSILETAQALNLKPEDFL